MLGLRWDLGRMLLGFSGLWLCFLVYVGCLSRSVDMFCACDAWPIDIYSSSLLHFMDILATTVVSDAVLYTNMAQINGCTE
jgi:hypothetical protein